MNECEHDFMHLETIKRKIELSFYSERLRRIDTFFCKKCLQYRDIKREEVVLIGSNKYPDWWYGEEPK